MAGLLADDSPGRVAFPNLEAPDYVRGVSQRVTHHGRQRRDDIVIVALIAPRSKLTEEVGDSAQPDSSEVRREVPVICGSAR